MQLSAFGLYVHYVTVYIMIQNMFTTFYWDLWYRNDRQFISVPDHVLASCPCMYPCHTEWNQTDLKTYSE